MQILNFFLTLLHNSHTFLIYQYMQSCQISSINWNVWIVHNSGNWKLLAYEPTRKSVLAKTDYLQVVMVSEQMV
jgi:hypothetical protein